MVFFESGERGAGFYLFFFLMTVWFLFFPLQGVLYQVTIYALPLLCLSMKKSRTAFKEILASNRLFLVILLVPVSCSFLVYLFYAAGAESLGEQSETFVRYVWRVVMFSMVCASLVYALAITRMQLARLILGTTVLHCVWALLASHEKIIRLFEQGRSFRLRGLLDSPNEFGLLMALGVVASLSLFTQKRRIRECVPYAVMALMCLLAVFLSQSRGAWLALVVGSAIFAFTWYRQNLVVRRWQPVFALSLLLLSGVIIVQNDVLHRRLERFYLDPARLLIWKHFLAVWWEHFWLGVYSLKDFGVPRAAGGGLFKNPHSIFLDAAVRMGVPGILSLLVFWGRCLSHFWSSRARVLLLPVAMVIFAGGLFSWSLYAKTFAQSLYALLLIFFFSDRLACRSLPKRRRADSFAGQTGRVGELGQ